MEVHQSREDYLEAILILREKHQQVRCVDVVNYLGYSKPSVTIAVGKLRATGFIIYDDNKYIHLTEQGEQLARTVYGKHNFLKTYLISIGVDEQTAEQDACRIEHVISDESIAKMKESVEVRP